MGSRLGPRGSMSLRRSNEATSALLERFQASGKASSQTMENACNAASTRKKKSFRQTFISASAARTITLTVIFCRCLSGLGLTV